MLGLKKSAKSQQKKSDKKRKPKKVSKRKLKKQAKQDLKKRNQKFVGEPGFTNPYGYLQTDPYLFINGGQDCISIFDVLVQYGTNNPAKIGWLLRLIPRDQINKGTIFLVQRQAGMDKSTEETIFEKRLHSNATTIANAKTTNAKQEAQNQTRIQDMTVSSQLAGRDESIVDSDVRLIVKAKNAKEVEEIISEIKLSYKNNDVKGIELIRRTGQQLDELSYLFDFTSANAWHDSDMLSVASSRLFMPSSGFSDPEGVYLGRDMRSLISNNPAVADFSGVRNGIVFMGGVAPFVSINGLEGGGTLSNGGSAVAHVIANSNYLERHRTHHIVLSDFDYQFEDSLKFDMSKESINPLEVFGTPKTVQNDANANFDKATTMMMMLTKMSDNSDKDKMAMNLKSIIMDWMIKRAGGNGMYTNNPDDEPMRANRILATDKHEKYPLPSDMIIELQRNVALSAKIGEMAQENALYLLQSLKTTFDAYHNIFGKATSLPDVFKANDLNIYYDLSKVSNDRTVTGAVFLNTLAYVTNRALNGEMIVIHGLDKINVPMEPLLAYKDRIERKNIGLLTVFEESENKEINPNTFSRFVGKMSRQDAVVLGGVTQEELEYIGKSWDHPLPTVVGNQLLASKDGVLYFYRASDRVGALVDTHLVLS